MFRVTLSDRSEFLAGDHTLLREIFHPTKHGLEVGYSLAHGTLPPGRQSKWHVLRSSEVYYFLSGQGQFMIDEGEVPVEAGTTLYVPPGGRQSLKNTGSKDIEFLCLVEPAWRVEDEQVFDSPSQ